VRHAQRGKGYIQHMVRFAVTAAVAALLALTGCGGAQEREQQEQQAVAAEKKLAEGRAFLGQLEQERKLLATKLTDANARLAESRGRLQRTLAGAAYLAAEPESGLVLDVDMGAARDGFLLEEAARAKDPEAITDLAVRVLDDQVLCTYNPMEETNAPDASCPPCEVAPYEDACSGVEAHRTSSPDWSCVTLARTGEGLPPTAFCTSVFQHPAPAGSVESAYSEQDLDTSLQVVRVAFAHEGQLHVSDYPAPEPTLYNPPNVGVLFQCGAETERNKCIYECQETHGRYEDPCACEETSAADPEEDSALGGESDTEDESPEVARARLAAEVAEQEAEAAREAAEEARKELQYQECLSSCEAPEASKTEDSNPSDSEEGAPRPTSAVVSMRLEAAPAPGIFVVLRERKLLGPQQQVVDSTPLTLVLRQPGLAALWRKKAPPDEALGKLEEVGQLDIVTTEAGKAALVSLPGVEGPALVGLLGTQVKAYAFNTKPGQEPVVAVEPAAICEGVRAEPKRFPQGVQDACAKLAAPAATAEVDAGTPEGPVDAGSPGSPTDAGTAAKPGEVAP
jgi:hypothetical protein